MKIQLNEKARNYFLKEGRDVIIKNQITYGWAGARSKPTVIVGKPEDPENYEHVDVDGINVYASKELKLENGTITINLNGIGPFQKFDVQGLL